MTDEVTQEMVEIYSVAPLTKEDLDYLSKKLPYLKGAKIFNKINPNLMAGFIIKTKDKIIDLSLHNRLIILKKIAYEISG